MINLKLKLKFLCSIILQNILKLFCFFPLKNQVLFISFDGKQYSDNPLYLSQYFKREDPYIKIIWVLKDVDKKINNCDLIIKRNSIKYFYCFCTSKTIITNNYISTFLPVRKKQIVLNTWHGGGCMKRVGFTSNSPNPYDEYFFKIQNSKYTAFNSTSKFVDDALFKESFRYNGELLPFGMPRNDILFSYNDSIIEKVYKYFNISRKENTGLVLYAPTFRGNANSAEFNKSQISEIFNCIDLLNKKFEKNFIFLFRAHHTMVFDINNSNVIVATDYPDMQELLCASDILITDYSSCSYDFSLMKKPVFLYVPDMNKYDKEQGFYMDIDKQPFPFGVTIEEFKDAIGTFNETKYIEQINDYHKTIGCYDKGEATVKTYEWLKEKWRN